MNERDSSRKRRALLNKLKRKGVTRAAAEHHIATGINASAGREGWRPSEIAMALAAWKEDLDLVYGK